MYNVIRSISDMISKKQPPRSTPYVDMDGFKVYYERIKD